MNEVIERGCFPSITQTILLEDIFQAVCSEGTEGDTEKSEDGGKTKRG